jgi:hypothetical protein
VAAQPQTVVVGSGMHKERLAVPTAPITEVITPSEAEPNIHPEVAELGVEHVSETPQLTLEDKKAGLEHASESTPVITQPSAHIQLPKTEAEVDLGLKTHKGTTNSIVWWLTLIKKQFKRLHDSGEA